ncbi:MAG: hypothetical protein LCH84_00770 [Gemmatimonadetes bacterium]|nr:hypothetical protein [Gemmatimonadota bacterium]
MAVADHEVTVILRDGRAVRLGIDTAEVEALFDAYRIRAEVEPSPGILGVPVEDFIEGGNDVVLFTGVTWSEPHGAMTGEGLREGSSMHFSGHPAQLSQSAEVVCVTTDAVVVASGAGRGILFRTGLRPGTVEVERNPEKVRAFLLERGYDG